MYAACNPVAASHGCGISFAAWGRMYVEIWWLRRRDATRCKAARPKSGSWCLDNMYLQCNIDNCSVTYMHTVERCALCCTFQARHCEAISSNEGMQSCRATKDTLTNKRGIRNTSHNLFFGVLSRSGVACGAPRLHKYALGL